MAAAHKLYVGGVPQTVSEHDLRELFGSCGTLADVHFIRDKNTGIRQTAAFILYSTKEMADRAIRELHDQIILPGAQTKMQIRYASQRAPSVGTALPPTANAHSAPPPPPASGYQLHSSLSTGGGFGAPHAAAAAPPATTAVTSTTSDKLYIAMLSRSTIEEDVKRILAPFGTAIEVHLLREKESKSSRGAGFIRMATREEAERVIAGLDGKYKDGDSPALVQVRWAQPRGTSSAAATATGVAAAAAAVAAQHQQQQQQQAANAAAVAQVQAQAAAVAAVSTNLAAAYGGYGLYPNYSPYGYNPYAAAAAAAATAIPPQAAMLNPYLNQIPNFAAAATGGGNGSNNTSPALAAMSHGAPPPPIPVQPEPSHAPNPYAAAAPSYFAAPPATSSVPPINTHTAGSHASGSHASQLTINTATPTAGSGSIAATAITSGGLSGGRDPASIAMSPTLAAILNSPAAGTLAASATAAGASTASTSSSHLTLSAVTVPPSPSGGYDPSIPKVTTPAASIATGKSLSSAGGLPLSISLPGSTSASSGSTSTPTQSLRSVSPSPPAALPLLTPEQYQTYYNHYQQQLALASATATADTVLAAASSKSTLQDHSAQLQKLLTSLAAVALPLPASTAASTGRGTALHVLNIPVQYTDADLHSLFAPFGPIIAAQVVPVSDATATNGTAGGGVNKGYGFVTFETAANAERAIAAVNGTMLGSKKVQVRFRATDHSATTNSSASKPY